MRSGMLRPLAIRRCLSVHEPTLQLKQILMPASWEAGIWRYQALPENSNVPPSVSRKGHDCFVPAPAVVLEHSFVATPRTHATIKLAAGCSNRFRAHTSVRFSAFFLR